MMPDILIASVQGWCLGGGLALVSGSDLAIASETAKLGMPEIIRGSYGAVATPTLFHSGIPFKVAFDIQLTGENLSGTEAQRVGLVSRVVSEEDLREQTLKLAVGVTQRHPVALTTPRSRLTCRKTCPSYRRCRLMSLCEIGCVDSWSLRRRRRIPKIPKKAAQMLNTGSRMHKR